MKKTELVLHTNKMCADFGCIGCCPDLRRGKIRATDLAHFARPHELIEGTERIGNRRFGIRLMQLVMIDPICSQPAQTRFDRFLNILR